MPTHNTKHIPEGWRETTLGEVVEFQRGFDLPTNNRTLGAYPLVVSNGVDGFVDEYKVKGPGVVTGRSGTLGKVLFIKQNFWPLNTTLWIKNFKGNNEKFIYYWLLAFPFEKFNAGSGVPTLNRNHIHQVTVKYPQNIPEQRAIADMLSSLDAKIELLREQNETLEKTAQTIFHEWFGRYSVESPEELPEGWRVRKLEEIANITSGKRPGEISEIQNENFNISLIGASKIMGYVQDFLFEGPTIVIGRVGTHGEIQKFYEKIYPSDNTLVIQSGNFVFVYFILKSIDYEKMNRGAVQPLITQTDLKNYPIIAPDIVSFEKFRELTAPIFEKILSNLHQIQSLSKTRDTLLPRLMSGEVNINN